MLRPSVIYRFVLNLFLIWLVLLAVFLALPSPIFEDDGTNFATAVLRSGKRLTRAYETGEYYPRIYGETYGAVLRAHEANKEWFMLDFQLVAGETAVMVHDQLPVALTPPDSPREKVSDPFVVDGRAGNVDGLLGLHPPWFQTADAVELAWQVQQSSAYLTLRTRWVDDSTVELWPDAQSWSGNETDNTPQPPQGWNNVDIQPMITIHTKAGKFASATTPHPPLSLSPTSTLRMRSYLLALLAPSAWLVYTTFAIIGMAVGTLTSLLTFAIIVTLLLYVVWVGMNRPSYDEYVERLKEKWADGVAYVRPLAPWRRRALSIRDGADVEKAQEEGKPFPV